MYCQYIFSRLAMSFNFKVNTHIIRKSDHVILYPCTLQVFKFLTFTCKLFSIKVAFFS